jgi:iron complex outermembrane receptor protein
LSLVIAAAMTPAATAQTRQITVWRDALDQFQNLSPDEQAAEKETLSRIRTGVEFWIRLHPSSDIAVAPAASDLAAEAARLKETVAKILAVDSSQSFRLGETVISVTAEASPISPVTDSVGYGEINDQHLSNVADAIQQLPGVALDRSASRGQTGIIIRGFDTKQVGVYLDNVPILVPYDGYADLSKFLTSDIANIDVAKGYSSPLLGPNGLGGAVNLVTRQPERKFEGDMSIGTGSGDALEAGIHVGTRWDKFFGRFGMDWQQTDYFPLSGKAPLLGDQTTYDRLNSDRHDTRYSGRFGYTPREGDQYVFTWTKQNADHSIPPYSGWGSESVRYLRYGYWNRDSYYLNTNTALGEASSIQFRAFLDFYPNEWNRYRDPELTVPQMYTDYDDHSEGFAAEFNTRLVPRNNLSASFFLKGDTHRKQDFNVARNTGAVTADPKIKDREYVTSIGIQDAITISPKLRATVGLSLDHLDSTWAQNIIDDANGDPIVAPFSCNGQPNDSFSACLMHKWTANPLASVSYSVGESGSLFFTFALKSHFPTMKDRYSDKNKSSIPNPSLNAERSRNYSLGYSHTFGTSTVAQIELFRSDMYDAIESSNFDDPTYNPNWTEDQYLALAQCPGNDYQGKCNMLVNVGKELNQGVELSFRTTPIRRFSLTGNYTYLMRKIYDMQTVFPTGTPKHRTVWTAEYQLPRGIQILAAARYEAGAFTLDRYNGKVPASNYATVDLGGVFPIKYGLKFQIGAKNLFDRYYYYQEGYPEAGRSWYLNMKYTF